MSRLNLLFVGLFVGILIWISFFEADKVQRIQNGALKIFSPFTRAAGTIAEASSSMGSDKMSYSELDESYEAVRRERDRLQLEVLQLDELLIENNELRRALQYKARSPFSLLPARVINRKPLNWYNTMIIDKGYKDGLEADLPVIAPLGNQAGLVGKISEVIGPHSSVVLLLTDEMCQVPARIRGTEEQGIVNGHRAPVKTMPDLKLRFLSKEADISAGDLIVSSGIGEVFRGDLVLGMVKEFKRGVIDTEATLVPSVDFEKLRDVFVIMPGRVAPSLRPEGEEEASGDSVRLSNQP